jgi:hypothetical protein
MLVISATSEETSQNNTNRTRKSMAGAVENVEKYI